jgi:hypothetical protein
MISPCGFTRWCKREGREGGRAGVREVCMVAGCIMPPVGTTWDGGRSERERERERRCIGKRESFVRNITWLV